MTAPSGGKISPPPVIRSGVGSFAIDPNFALNQTVKVAIRVRPSHNSDEQQQESAANNNNNNKKLKNADKKAWNLSKTGAMDTLTQKGTARKIEGKTVFHFDQVFDEETQTPLVYKSVARSMVKSVLDGKHATLFAYGQTGSGKTFTMQGEGRSQSGQAGVIQLVVADLFRFMKQGQASKRDYTVKVCYVEVYSETIRDLLADDVGSTASLGTPSNSIQGELEEKEKVKLRTTPNGDVVMDCTHVEVSSVEEVLELLVDGNTQRVVSKLDMNTHSPRSHSILRIMVESRAKQQSFKGLVDDDGNGVVLTRVSDFNLVDLAGSENVKDISNGNMRVKQGSSVNKSLLTLSSIIHSLGLPEKKRPKHIPYEESKLTRILQPHLKGNSDMAILCCVSPSKALVEETKSTLKFAVMAKNVQVTPKVNEIQDDAALIRKLRSELAAAKKHAQDMEGEQKHSESPPYYDDPHNNNNLARGGGGGDGGGDVDYGYEDMDAPMANNEQYGYEDMDAPQQQLHGHHHPPENRGGYANHSAEDSVEGSVEDPFFRSVEYDNYNDEEEEQADDIVDDGGEEYDEEYERMNASAEFKVDFVDPDRANKQVQRYLNGKTTSYDTDENRYYQDDDYADDDEVDQDYDDDDYYGSSPLDRVSSTNPKSQYYRQRQQHEHDQQQPRQEFPMPGRYNPDEVESDEEEDSGYDSPDKNKTAKTEDESYDDGPEASYADISLKVGSVVSAPDTLKGETSMMLAAAADHYSAGYGTVESAQDRALDGRGNNHDVSWDTMDLNTTRPEHVGEPIRAMQSIYKRDVPIPDEITIMHVTPLGCGVNGGDEVCLLDRLNDAEARSAFLQGKLDMTDDLVEGVFKDLERARLCIHDLVYRNVQLAAKLKEKRREDVKEEYQDGEKAVEQYWLLKGSMYVGLFFFFFGGYEYFMAAVLLVWLILEANLST